MKAALSWQPCNAREVAVRLDDWLGPLLLRTWFERDEIGERLEFGDHHAAAATLRRVAQDPGVALRLRGLAAELGARVELDDHDALIRRLADALVRGGLELVRLPYLPIVSTPVERHELDHEPRPSELSAIPELLVFGGRVLMIEHDLDPALELEPPPELVAELRSPPPPELDVDLGVRQLELDAHLVVQ